jgi:hypothetical protein
MPAQAGTFTYTLICRGGGYGESNSESATLTVNSAMVASLMTGNACCNRLEPFAVTGIATASRENRFLLLDTHYVGKVGSAQSAYATCSSCLAGRLKKDPNDFKLITVAPRQSARASVRTSLRASGTDIVEFTVHHDASQERPAGAAAVEGIYTTNLGTGYTLTIAVDSAGEVMGNDTNGCRLAGRVSPSDPRFNDYNVVLDVSACGSSNGRYGGKAALMFDDAGNAIDLFLSASNAGSAIGWRLSR